ncbi:MAG: hypothetical protein JXA62_07755 [Candidatus Aminicenantes bacterium]|nr:hypothetical protein [Candidatus Aminicenantes bacterium]
MGYFTKGIGDQRFWLIFVGLPLIAALNLADFLTATLAPPGVFNYWVMRITVVGGFLVALLVATRNSKKLRAQRLEAARQKNFESIRLEELRRRVAVEPDFQTLCYRCRHFDREKSTCQLQIFNLAARKVRLDTPFQYCLYYEPAGGDSL